MSTEGRLPPGADERERIRARYLRRSAKTDEVLHDPLRVYKLMELQERERAFARCFRYGGLAPLSHRKGLEVGCGNGQNLLRLLSLGFEPANLTGIDLLEGQVDVARRRLPKASRILVGDATEMLMGEEETYDVVLQSTVFSSILDDDFQAALASRMWSLLRPGRGVLWHDFIFNNPANPDVRGVPTKRVRELFPDAEIKVWRTNLAPPLARRLAGDWAGLYTLLNALPFLRTHVVCWITKPPR